DLLLLHEVDGVPHARLGLITVVERGDHELPAVDAAPRVHLRVVGGRAAPELGAETRRRALEGRRHADLDVARAHAGRAGLEWLEPDDVVDEKGRRQLIALDDEGLGTARGARGLEPQEGAQVHEGHEAASQVGHPDQVRGRQGYLRVLVEDHDLARESHFRRVESVAEPDQARARLRRGRRRYRGRRGHLTNCLTMLTSCSGVKGLPRYSSAPWRFPQTRSLSWFLELTSTTGVCRVRASRLMLRRSS